MAGGGRAIAVGGDVASEDDVTAIVAAVARAIGGPTILVNNAAASVAGAAPWHELAPEEWDEVLRTNVTGTFLCARAVHPFMQRRGRGRIITMGSVRVRWGVPATPTTPPRRAPSKAWAGCSPARWGRTASP